MEARRRLCGGRLPGPWLGCSAPTPFRARALPPLGAPRCSRARHPGWGPQSPGPAIRSLLCRPPPGFSGPRAPSGGGAKKGPPDHSPPAPLRESGISGISALSLNCARGGALRCTPGAALLKKRDIDAPGGSRVSKASWGERPRLFAREHLFPTWGRVPQFLPASVSA